ncbi:uncharacterized protein [Procambarus clarkii]|uniref:uncharacterized protein isoform X2 n=1 Tax=Procambarus clarkii TaxID=6728 RepID=UPI001E6732D2|nr:uncharacterized protein LOC123770448 isoform X2 [Procambarus clarkii]
MASGNTSGLGASLFRGALHGNTSNTNSLGGNSNIGNQQQQHQQQHHHHSTGHLPQQSSVASSGHIHHPQQPQPSQSQPTLGAVTFNSDESARGRGTPGSPDHMSTVMAKLWFDHNVESSLSSLKKEEHEKRMRDLRKQLEYIADTNWKYSPVEKYIGQQ